MALHGKRSQSKRKAKAVEEPLSESEEIEDEYEVERVVAHRPSKRRPGTTDYLIKWKNYDDDSNTWENEKNVFSAELLDKYWLEHGKTKDRKRRPVVQPATAESPPLKKKRIDRKEKEHHDLEEPELSVEPPAGLQWDDAKGISQIYADNNNALFAKLEWSDGQSSMIRTSILRDVVPILLIEFYEQHLSFSKEDSQEAVTS